MPNFVVKAARGDSGALETLSTVNGSSLSAAKATASRKHAAHHDVLYVTDAHGNVLSNRTNGVWNDTANAAAYYDYCAAAVVPGKVHNKAGK